MNDNVFRVKEALRIEQVTEYYGLSFNRAGFALCPFHDEKTPSFKLHDGRFKCFGCNESGDIFSFVMKLFNLNFHQAVLRLASDFGIYLPDNPKPYDKSSINEYKEEKTKKAKELNEYRREYERRFRLFVLLGVARSYPPKRMGDIPHPLWLRSLSELDELEQWINTHERR